MHISEHETLMPNRELSDDTIRKNDDPELNTQYLNIVPKNIDQKFPPSKFAACYEVNCNSNASKFTILPFRSFACDL